MGPKKISQLAFASVYGYIMSCMRMICEPPDKLDPVELFEHCIRSSVAIWGIPDALVDEIWTEVKGYMSVIPEDVNN